MKKGFSIIELVFAIVVIGLTASVFPRLIAQSQLSNETAIKQELVYNVSTMAHRINNASWDSVYYSTIPARTTAESLPKYTGIAGGGAAGVAGNVNSDIGIIQLGQHIGREKNTANSYRQSENMAPSTKAQFRANSFDSDGSAAGAGVFLDVDDFDNQAFNFLSTPDNGDFIVSTRMNVTVNYLGGAVFAFAGRTATINLDPRLATAATAPSNIKMVTLTATDRNGGASPLGAVTQYMFVNNIGEQRRVNTRVANVPLRMFNPTFTY